MKESHSCLIPRLVDEMQVRNYSPRTVTTYSGLLSKVENYFELPLDQLTTDQFKSYLHHRITVDQISISMINQHISAFKLLQTDILQRDWEPVKIKRPRKVKKLPVVLSIAEVERMIDSTRNIKHKTILMLAYSAGLRLQEVSTLRLSAIDSSRMQVHVVQGKGKKDRYTILSKKVLEYLRLYYKLEKPKTFLFEPQSRKGRQISTRTLQIIVKQSCHAAGINKKVTFHTLRHSFATHLLEKGVNLRMIQQLLGHTSLSTTSGYLHVANISPSGLGSPLDSMNI